LLSRTEQWSLNTIIIDPCNAAEIAQRVLQANPDLGYNVVSVADWHDLQEEASSGGAWATLPRHVSAAVVPVFRDALPGRITAPAWSAALSLPATVYGMSITGDFSRYVDGREITLFTFRAGLPRPMALVAKEVVDRVVASVLLLLTAPVFLIVITLVSLDGGPAFFGHARVGFGGRPFKCLKFRTMVPSAEAVLQEFLANNPEAEQEWASSRKLRVDPRVTRVGAWLRKTSIDELPQLLNVLRGEMSLVGPRPIVIEEMEKYGDNIVYYTSVNPGITGLWQVSGRSNLDYARRVALDTNYVKYWKFRHDIKILLRTVPAVLMKDGAC
jgi:lipopolysaccharide/colanic/teichoic acid biosynthesis glycosyltransferase